MQGLRIGLVAGSMQKHWMRICRDKNRDIATCPNSDACAYFGERIFAEGQAILSGYGG
jgi:hypothetical protein